MNRRALIVSAFAAVAPPLLARGAAPPGAVSGDSLIDVDGEIRLADIAAPPSSAPFADEARAALDRLLGGSLQVEEVAARDRWGRRVAKVVDAGGAALQERLIAAGAARVRPETDDYAFIRRLLEREREARAARLGLWRLADYRIRDSADAADAIGGFHLVEGVVRTAEKVRGRVYVNFDDDFRTDFSLTAKSGLARRWARDGLVDLVGLAGARLRSRGYVASINGPSIEVAHPLQIERIDGAA